MTKQTRWNPRIQIMPKKAKGMWQFRGSAGPTS
jgi:hypothetical protein